MRLYSTQCVSSAVFAPGIQSQSGDVAIIAMSPAQFRARLEEARAHMNPVEWSLTMLRTTAVQHSLACRHET